MKNGDGLEVMGFHDLVELSVSLFDKIFQEPSRANIAEVIQVVTQFHKLVSREDNIEMLEGVSRIELYNILSIMNKGKSLGPDG